MDLVIGLIGAKASGKTTAYEAMANLAKVQEITLAKKLKDVCADITQVERDSFDSHDLKEQPFEIPVFLTWGMLEQLFKSYGLEVNYDQHIRPHIGMVLHSPRHIAQYIGTEVLRAVEHDIHCRVAYDGVQAPIGVVTDMRFPNEFEYFAKNAKNFIPVYIKNVGAEIEAGRDTHASEAYLQDLAAKALFTIENDKDLKTFQDRVKLTFETILGGVSV